MAAKIVNLALPRELYRYRSLTNAQKKPLHDKFEKEIDALQNGYLWASAFKDMNDPMEGMYRSSERFNLERLSKIIADYKIGTGIISFSENSKHELMWAHYASCFSGICIAYDVDRLLYCLNEDDMLVRLSYEDELPELIFANYEPSELARHILAKKNHRWSYEREWRLLTDRLQRVKYHDVKCVSGIILGSNIEYKYGSKLTDWAINKNIPVSELKIEGYNLLISKLR